MLETILILEQRVQRETIHGSNAPGGTGQGIYGLVTANGQGTTTTMDTGQSNEINIGNGTIGISILNGGSHTHIFTSDSTGPHTHPFTSTTTGNGQPFNVMQPTIFVGNVFIYYG